MSVIVEYGLALVFVGTYRNQKVADKKNRKVEISQNNTDKSVSLIAIEFADYYSLTKV